MKYLIPCTGKKRCPTLYGEENRQSSLANLSFNNELGATRNLIIRHYINQLDWSKCLPAYRLYAGKIFQPISKDNWSAHGGNVLILSALFGIVKYDDLLPIYDLKMDSSNNLNIQRRPLAIWSKSGELCNVLAQYNEVTDLLSNSYRDAIGDCDSLITFNDFDRDRGSARGGWLNDHLNNI
jgi:cytoplasmic iron level regulating protein YaaA (DUF328/UPF0246 family)